MSAGGSGGTPDVASAKSGLPGVGELFSGAWRVFRERWLLLIGVGILPWIIGAVLFIGTGIATAGVNFYGSGSTGINAGVVSVLLLTIPIVIVLSAVSGAAQVFIAANEQRVTFGEAFRWGFSRVLPLIGLGVLQILILCAALIPGLVVTAIIAFALGFNFGTLDGAGAVFMILFFLMLVLVLILLVLIGIRLLFAMPLVALKESAVLESFRKSWRLTGGRFWPLLGRVLVAFLVGLVINMILGFIPIVGSLAQVVISAYFMVYFVLLFRATQRAAGASPVMPATPIVPAAS